MSDEPTQKMYYLREFLQRDVEAPDFVERAEASLTELLNHSKPA